MPSTPPTSPPQNVMRQVQSGEYLLWSGQPVPQVFSAGDLLVIPFCVLWLLFALVWTVVGLTGGAPASVVLLMGLPFVLAGLYASAGRLALAWLAQKRTWYVLTTRRVLVVTGARVRSLALVDLPPLTTTTRRGGRGTVVIGSRTSSGGQDLLRWLIWGTPASVAQPDAGAVLANIDNAQAVAEAILQAKEQVRAAS